MIVSEYSASELEKHRIQRNVISGWWTWTRGDSVARASNVVSHSFLQCLTRLGHLIRMPDDRSPKRVQFGHMNVTATGLQLGGGSSEALSKVHHDDHAIRRALNQLVEKMLEQGSLQGCHEKFAGAASLKV